MHASFLFVALVLLSSCGISLDTPSNLITQSSSSMAGTWNATGITDTLGGLKRSCADKSFTISRTAGITSDEFNVTISERSFSCANGSYTTSYEQVAFTEVDGKLYRNGRHAGELSAIHLEFDIKLTDTKTWSLSLSPSGGSTLYSESVTGSSTTGAVLSR